ncbi:MAG: endopeptidase La [Eubacteriales bacterium]|nr:endopeptidase La [Eubacteriales bacterium]
MDKIKPKTTKTTKATKTTKTTQGIKLTKSVKSPNSSKSTISPKTPKTSKTPKQPRTQLRLPASHEISTLEHETMPMIPLRGLVVYPGLSLTFDVARDRSRAAVRAAMADDQLIFLAAQVHLNTDWPVVEDIYKSGCVARIRQVFEANNTESIKLLVEGVHRARRVDVISDDPYYIVECASYLVPNVAQGDLTFEAYRRQLMRHFEKYSAISSRISSEAIMALNSITDVSLTADTIISYLNIQLAEKQQFLEIIDIPQRVNFLIDVLTREQSIAELEKEIGEKVRSTIEKNQKEYYLREQIKVIQGELGDNEGSQEEQDRYLVLLSNSSIPAEYQAKITKEIGRLSRMQSGNPEGGVLRTYLDLLFEMPWGKVDPENLDIPNARAVLNKDHYGLEKVKDRILEYLAVRKLRMDAGVASNKGPILCLVGPPGVGKTSIARSVAEALGRKYVRMSLGGVHDEAEIRGHRRTYIGAMPGRIINAIRQSGKDNPLMLLDEIDKLGSDYRGDPSSALLEVLDPEQNNSFRDHYLEIPYDLSHVLFITTANTTETIPQALLDRMEVVYLSGYTEEEKIEIATRHLLPHQLKQNALKKSQLSISREGLRSLISGYTREAGVRQLERELAHVCRRVAIQITEEKATKIKVVPNSLEDLIGKIKFRFEKASEKDQIGVATGLAWTYAGGDTLMIEVNIMPGNGHLELTGQLGDVMKESARAALTYIRTRAASLGIPEDFGNKSDIHIHVPAGATPKDGPSAGITLATALASALSGRPVRRNVAMTGEITLRGRILPIGGLKEKVIAAHRAGIDTVLIPVENQRDAVEIPATVQEKVKMIFVRSMDEVFEQALVKNK